MIGFGDEIFSLLFFSAFDVRTGPLKLNRGLAIILLFFLQTHQCVRVSLDEDLEEIGNERIE